jgi:hypothetical protein
MQKPNPIPCHVTCECHQIGVKFFSMVGIVPERKNGNNSLVEIVLQMNGSKFPGWTCSAEHDCHPPSLKNLSIYIYIYAINQSNYPIHKKEN